MKPSNMNPLNTTKTLNTTNTPNTIDCNACQALLADILLEPDRPLDTATTDHLAACTACRNELAELQATVHLLDQWTAPEPSPYFDARVRAHLRDEQQAAPGTAAARFWGQLLALLHLDTGRALRPALAGVFAFVLLLGGGTVATLWGAHHGPVANSPSPTLNDLKILDNNAQALQQLDLLDDQSAQAQAPEPQS